MVKNPSLCLLSIPMGWRSRLHWHPKLSPPPIGRLLAWFLIMIALNVMRHVIGATKQQSLIAAKEGVRKDDVHWLAIANVLVFIAYFLFFGGDLCGKCWQFHY